MRFGRSHGIGLVFPLLCGLFAACAPSVKDSATAEPTAKESRDGAASDAPASGAGEARAARPAMPNMARQQPAPAVSAANAKTVGTAAPNDNRAKARQRAGWAGLKRAQLARPTDFAKLTAELKRKQALAAGLDEAAVRAELEKRALAGDVEAALTLGLMLRYGDAATDKAEGEKLIAAAAETGNPRAMAELGRILLADETRADGPAQAEAWLRKAWAAGESEGAFLLASAQRLGLLEPAAGEDATKLLLAAAEAGNDGSRRLLMLLRKEIDGPDRAQLEGWMTAMAEAGDVDAMLQMVTLKREAGQSAAALSWLERAAAGGSPHAIMALALFGGGGEAGARARGAAITHLRTQLAAPVTASPRGRYDLARLLVLETERVEENQAEALGLLRDAGRERIYQAAIAAMLIEDGTDARAALQTVLKMDDAAAYVRYVELLRAKGDNTYSALADEMPKPTATTKPIYPIELKAAGTTGDVTVRFQVRADGTVATCEVLKSDHPAFSAAAVEAVQQWRFQPGIKEGKPVDTQMQITLPFRLPK